MLKEELRELFKDYDPAVQVIIAKVLLIEQEKISMERPRVREDIDRVIDAITRQELERDATAGDRT